MSPSNVHLLDATAGRIVDELSVNYLAVLSPTGEAEADRYGMGLMLGPPANRSVGADGPVLHLAAHPTDDQGRAVWCSSEDPPALERNEKKGLLLKRASLAKIGDTYELVRAADNERMHLICIETGIPEPMELRHLDRRTLLEHFTAEFRDHKGLPIPHGSVALEPDATLIASFGQPAPELLYAFEYRTLNGIPYKRVEFWAVYEGCRLYTVSMSPTTRLPFAVRVLAARTGIKLEPPKKGDFERFRERVDIPRIVRAA